MRNIRIGVVIPTLNEEENLKMLLPKLRDLLPSTAKIIIVDDLSNDGTAEVARSYKCVVPYTFKRRGLGRSYRDGVSIAKYIFDCDTILLMDADHPWEPIPGMIQMLNNFDMVIGHELGSRSKESRVAGNIARKVLKLNFSQATCGYIAFKGELLDKIELREIKSKGDAWHLEFLLRAVKAGAKVGEFEFNGIPHGKASLKRIIKWIWEVARI